VRWKRAALQGARWLQSQATETEHGPMWEVTTEHNGRTSTRASEGLYTGTAGIAWVLAELGVAFKAPALTATARRAADGLCARAQKDEDGGLHWPATGTDIISGNAGIGCALLELHRLLRRDAYLQTARGAAIWLQGQAMTEGEYRKWSSHVGWTRHYPGFSHGTAGIVFFFVRLHRTTKERRWLAAARAGGEWLSANAQADGDGCKWVHFEPATGKTTKPAFRTGWCHGPAGTGLGLLALHTATGEARWLELAEQAAAWEARATRLASDRPSFWSPSRCCGAAGIAEYCLTLYQHTGKAVHLERARLAAKGLHRLARPDAHGMRWTNSARPDKDGKIYYGTSLQLGAAGEGLAFLRLAAAEAALAAAAKGSHAGSRPGPIELPDRRW
jgi:lantibiotic modifying enzyme